MNHHNVSNWMRGRTLALAACAAIAMPLVGCGSSAPSVPSGVNQPPVDAYANGGASRGAGATMPTQASQSQGMSTKKKLVLLAGAAALYYLYRKHQANSQANATTQNGQQIYYLSKNGRVYYRDNTGRAVYVSPPTQPIPVPYEEAQRYQGIQGLQGYDNSQTGETDLSRFATQGSN